MPIVPIGPGIDARVVLVDATGSQTGSAGNPLITQGSGGGGATTVQGTAATGAAVSGNPVYGGGKDASGNVQPIAIATFADVNGTLTPAATLQRIAADLMLQSAGANLTNRVRCAADMVGGVGGGSHLGQGIGIYNPGQAKFFPVIGNADGSLAVGGYSTAVTVTLTRPANVTAYSAQDEVGTSGTSPVSIAISRITGGTGIITGARLTYASNPTTTPSFRLLLFNASVTLAGDNSPLALSSADGKKFIGLIDFTVTQAGGTATSAPVMAGGVPVAPIPFMTDTIFGALITLNGFTPIANSEQIQISVDAEQN